MRRRGFLSALCGGMAAVTISIPKPRVIVDAETGISMRHIQKWDSETQRMIMRADCLLGVGAGYVRDSTLRLVA